MRVLTEKRIEANIIRACRQLGCFVTKLSQPRPTMQTAGVPDLFICHGRWGVAFWVEVKRPGGRVSTAQAIWHREARAAGQNVIVAMSIDDVLAEMRRQGAPIQQHAWAALGVAVTAAAQLEEDGV